MVPDRVMVNGVDNNVYGIDPDYWAVATLRGFETDKLAKTGDNDSYEMISELTLEAREERSSFAIRDLIAFPHSVTGSKPRRSKRPHNRGRFLWPSTSPSL